MFDLRLKAVLALSLMVAACSGHPKPAGAPTGPYNYESVEAGVKIDSTVNVRYDADSTVVDEEVHIGQVTANIESRLDPKTFSARTYAIHNDPERNDPSISVTKDGASVNTTRGRAIVKAPVPGAPSWIFGNYASSFVMLPSLVRATKTRITNAYMPNVFRGKAFALKLFVIPATLKPPAEVPAADAAISLAPAGHRPAMVTVWYDPATSVVDAVTIGTGAPFVRKP